MRTLSIEIKIIIGVVFFTLFIVGLERYQLSENIIDQFIESKKSKNKLLIDTISPIISLNMSLGLSEANNEYLDLIIKQNKDLKTIEITDADRSTIFKYPKDVKSVSKAQILSTVDTMNSCSRPIIDDITKQVIGYIYLEFYNNDYDLVLSKNSETTLKIFLVTFVLLTLYTFLIKREFKNLRVLTKSVLEYDPKVNNFTLTKTNRLDEVGIIHNAIITMVSKINSYATILDKTNLLLEEKVEQRTKELQDANEKLEKLATIDPLTQVYNRRYFEKHINKIWEMSKRTNTTISIIMCDIDHFKNFNDTYGHITGDHVLQSVAAAIKGSLKRVTDVVARYGGEEFIIVMYDTEIEGALQRCEEIQNRLKQLDTIIVNDTNVPPITLSFGVSSTIPTMVERYELLIKAADVALYHAKEKGRNCIIINKV